MKRNIRCTVGYQIPEYFMDQNVAYDFLIKCGIKNPNKSIGKLYYYLNHLRVTSHLIKYRYGESGRWVSINTNISKHIYGNLQYFYKIHKGMIDEGFVEEYLNGNSKSSYEVGKSSKKYRLKDILNNQEWGVVRINCNACTTTRKVLEFQRKKWRPVDFKLYESLTKFNTDRIPFFEETTLVNYKTTEYTEVEMIKTVANNKLLERKRRSIHGEKDRLLQNTMDDIYSFYKDSYIAIRDGIWRYTVDDFGRRHTNITNLPKYLKESLYIIKAGEKRRLVTIDIANSQVLLLLTILPERLKSYGKFKELVQSGNFYQFLAEKLNLEYNALSKKIIKKKYFVFVYGDSSKPYVWNSSIYEIMKAEFPDIVLYVNKYKKRYGYQKPAQKMQLEESNIIISQVCSQASKMHLDFTQIYDSILCLQEDAEFIKNLIIKAFAREYLNVTVRIE